MHIPEGFLSAGVATTMNLISIASIVYSIKKVKPYFTKPRALLAAATAALIFALQMLNFPVAEGTSGHFMGAALAGILLGPVGAIITLAAVLIIQCLVFGDGGVLALGANIFNLGIVGGLVAYYTYKWLNAMYGGMAGLLFAVFVSSWLTIVMASVSCGIMLGVSGTAPTSDVLRSMTSIHMLIGIGEGMITLIIMLVISKVKPALLDIKACLDMQEVVKPCIVGCGVALFLAIFLSPYACPFLDGLEKVAENHNFLYIAEGKEIFPAPIPDYVFPGIKSEAIATSISGLAGTLITFLFLFLATGIFMSKKHEY
ncbi:MAG: energy-coupling factor ABC transporter permease [Thermodesulfobacteriota bacterium]